MQKTNSKLKRNPSRQNRTVAPEIMISGERPYGLPHTSGRQTITVKISDAFIVLYVKNAPLKNPTLSELYIYVFSRKDGSVWAGDTVQEGGKIRGGVVYKWDDAYLCVINSIKAYLGDLFLIRPNDLRLFDVMSEVGSHRGSVSDSLFKIFSKILKD